MNRTAVATDDEGCRCPHCPVHNPPRTFRFPITVTVGGGGGRAHGSGENGSASTIRITPRK